MTRPLAAGSAPRGSRVLAAAATAAVIAGCGGEEVGGGDAGPDPAFVSLGGGVWISPARPQPGGQVRLRYQGTLAAEPTLLIRYGFDGWNAVDGFVGSSGDDGTGNQDVYQEEPLSSLESGSRQVTLTMPTGAHALHLVFRTAGATPRWDSHDGRDFNIGFEVPYLGPFLTWDGVTATATAISVHFHSGYVCDGVVEHGRDGVLDTSTAGGATTDMHHVVLTGLEPGVEYSYRVGCADGERSPVYRFRTVAADASEVTFVVAGDAQDSGEGERWRNVTSALAGEDAAFIVFAGDLAWNDKPGLWWVFFDRARQVLAETPIVAVPGNHDTPGVDSNPDTTSFRHYFGLDGSDAVPRAQRIGPAAFLLLNSEGGDEMAINGLQDLLAAMTLATWRASQTPWAFAVYHIPPYNAGKRHASQQGQFRDITRHFDGIVDWVLTGHEHLYQRMKPLRYNAVLVDSYGRGDGQGVGYLVVPPAGAWPETAIVDWDGGDATYRDRLAYPPLSSAQNTVPSLPGYAVIRLAGSSFQLDVVSIDGTARAIIDQLSYDRP